MKDNISFRHKGTLYLAHISVRPMPLPKTWLTNQWNKKLKLHSDQVWLTFSIT